MLKRKIINKAFTIISILSLIYINQLLANNTENNADNSKKCVVYRDGKLIYNPDNPKIHCTTLQILDNFWDDNNNTNVPNPNKRPEDFTEILTEKDIISNGNVVCKNPSASNATFTVKEALEGETISGTCNTGYTGTVSAICQKDSSWSIKNNCFSNCNNLKDMYTGIDFNDTIETISNDEFAYSKCDIGYNGFKKHTCKDGIVQETTNQCRLNTSYCLKLTTDVENGSITYSNNNQAINSTATLKCNTGYEVINGNNTIVCNANDETNGKWSGELGKCEIKLDYCPEITARNGSITYTDDQTIGSVATLTCSGNYDIFGEKEVKCITDETNKDNDTGKWDKELGDCGVVIQYYSPRNNVVKEKTIKKGETFKCYDTYFDGNPDAGVVKLCRIKGSDKYFGNSAEQGSKTYTVNDALFSQQDTACHIGYVNRDLGTQKDINTDFENNPSYLYDGKNVYSSDYGYGLRKSGEKYIINCISGYTGKPEIVCKNGKWSWTPDKDNKTDNQCYKGGCDVTDYAQSSKNLVTAGWGLETKGCSVERDTTRKIIPEGSWASAECKNGYISNFDNPVCDTNLTIKRQKSVFGKCVNGNIEHKPTGSSQHGSACVKGCAYGDKDNGWTSEMMANTVDGNYAQHDAPGWGAVNIGKYAVRKAESNSISAIVIYKDCASGYHVDNSSQAYSSLSYPVVQCNYDNGTWSQHGGYKMGCTK